jgi:hypothetical protein
MVTKKFVRQIYKTDGREMIELQRGESVAFHYALITGRTTLDEVQQIKQARKCE